MNYEKYDIDDFLSDEAFQQWVLHPTKESNSFWEAWLQQYPEKATIITQARQLLKVAATPEKDSISPLHTERLWQKIHQSIHTSPKTFHGKKLPKHSRVFFTPAWQVAASVASFILIGFMAYYYLQGQAATVYTTAYKETKNITLPDGSHVVLNANSTLRVKDRWLTDEAREVWLEGEAFFSVAEITLTAGKRKFIVHATNLDIEVLGTKFNVNDREDKTSVVLASGKVKLKMQQDEGKAEMTMTPGEMVEFSKGKKAVSKKTVNPEIYSSWKENKLVFERESVKDICETLKNTYGWKIVLKDASIAERKYTGTFIDPDPEVILKTIATVLDIQIKQDGNQVIFE